jgi:hypothetical protein
MSISPETEFDSWKIQDTSILNIVQSGVLGSTNCNTEWVLGDILTGMKLNIHLHPLPTLRKSGVVPPYLNTH